MKKMNKTVFVTTLGALLAISAMGSAFAAEPAASVSKQAPSNHAIPSKKGANLEQLAAEKGVTVDELKAQMEQQRGNRGPAREPINKSAYAKEQSAPHPSIR